MSVSFLFGLIVFFIAVKGIHFGLPVQFLQKAAVWKALEGSDS
jgi:hypothetical protein